ncbi:transcriptional regulator [Enterococcus florum]|uniref:Transcriptional regulator n=1 Tax=Enterococcus florum TaxID=2480627 RepID=A0A4P5PS71_9ENTE|nr:MurR/RpiR family transcriptional regulator [Enterococcus florum]GCF95493.1 transcriptional regulator [Enterococcus florum]
MLIDKLEEKNDFTNTEIVVANYILENLLEINEITIADLAKRTFTSKATIIRFCKKLGLFGFVDLQKKLSQEMIETKRLTELLNEEPVNEETTNKEVMNIVPSIYEKAITDTRLSINPNQMNRVLNRLKHVSKLDIYGTGITYSVAKTAAFKFSTLRIESEAHDGMNEHYILATQRRKNRIAIVLSFTGKNKMMVAVAKYLRKTGAFVIGIGDEGNGRLSEQCDEYFEIYQKKLILSMEVITAITATNYVIDILFISQLVSDYEQNKTNAIDVITNKIHNDIEFDT